MTRATASAFPATEPSGHPVIGRVLLAALLAGVVAGLVMGAIQHVRITPLILQAEALEQVSDVAAWSPADGWERTFFTTVVTALTGAAFAILLAGLSLLTGIAITPRNGLIWGFCAFLAITLAPAAGLPPELPGMPAGDLVARQVWWAATILATGIALYLIAVRSEPWAKALAVVLIALPHIVGAPLPLSHETAVPAGLAAAYASNVIAAAALFWCLIGVFTGFAMQRFSRELAG